MLDILLLLVTSSFAVGAGSLSLSACHLVPDFSTRFRRWKQRRGKHVEAFPRLRIMPPGVTPVLCPIYQEMVLKIQDLTGDVKLPPSSLALEPLLRSWHPASVPFSIFFKIPGPGSDLSIQPDLLLHSIPLTKTSVEGFELIGTKEAVYSFLIPIYQTLHIRAEDIHRLTGGFYPLPPSIAPKPSPSPLWDWGPDDSKADPASLVPLSTPSPAAAMAFLAHSDSTLSSLPSSLPCHPLDALPCQPMPILFTPATSSLSSVPSLNDDSPVSSTYSPTDPRSDYPPRQQGSPSATTLSHSCPSFSPMQLDQTPTIRRKRRNRRRPGKVASPPSS